MRHSPGGRRGAGAGLRHRINLFRAQRPGRDTLQMVSFNHGVSSLTRKDLALKYNLCVLLCEARRRLQGHVAAAPACSCTVGGLRGVSWKETPHSHRPEASQPTASTLTGPCLRAQAEAARQEIGQRDLSLGRRELGRGDWLNPYEFVDTRCWHPGTRWGTSHQSSLYSSQQTCGRSLSPMYRWGNWGLEKSDHAKQLSNVEAQGCSTAHTRPLGGGVG